MKRFIVASILVLFAGVAAAQQPAAVGAPNQIVRDHTVTIRNVSLQQPGFVTVTAPNRYGNANAGPQLGRVYLSAGHHENVKVSLNPQLMNKYGYVEGSEHTAYVEVAPKANAAAQNNAQSTASSGQPAAVEPFEIRIPDPVDEIS